MAQLKSENEALLAQAREERTTMLREAKETKDKIIGEAKEQAKIEANKIIVDAQQQIQQQKMAALTEVRNEIGSLAISVAEQILRTQLNAVEGQDTYMKMLAGDIKLN